MRTTKTMRIGSVTIPAGASIAFSAEGYAIYKGVKISKTAVQALEDMSECGSDCQSTEVQSGFTAEVSEQFFDKHGNTLTKSGITYHSKDSRQVTFDIPTSMKGAQVLCRVLTQEGHDADQIALMCPELARRAGLVDDAYLQALLDKNEIIGAKWSRHEVGGVESVTAVFDYANDNDPAGKRLRRTMERHSDNVKVNEHGPGGGWPEFTVTFSKPAQARWFADWYKRHMVPEDYSSKEVKDELEDCAPGCLKLAGLEAISYDNDLQHSTSQTINAKH